MKRVTTPDTHQGSPKRAKLSPLSESSFFDGVPDQSPDDILLHGVDEEKWLRGRFKMVWPPVNGRIETLVSVHSSRNKEDVVFPIFFQLGEKHLAHLTMSPPSQFRLSLRGAEVSDVTQNKHISTLPIQLMFSRGVEMMWKLHGIDSDIKSLNTWSTTKAQHPTDNPWYYSEEEEEGGGGREKVEITPQTPVSSQKSPVVKQILVHEEVQQVVAFESKENKKRQRLEAKRQRKEALANAVTPAHIPNQVDSLVETSSVKTPRPTEFKSPSTPPKKGVILPGLNTARYQPISDIRLGQFAQLSGIVVGVSELKKTSRNEWMCFVEIVDTSSTRSDSSGQWKGIKINCFTKRYKEWLPCLQRGDAVILRDIKIEQFYDRLSGVGHNNRLRWAAYSPAAGEIYYGPPNNAPRSEKLAAGFGAEFSPFYEPDEVDIQHLITLSDWWRKLAEKDKSDSVAPIQHGYARRCHRLISEAGPYVEPNGYFDCTVEVLKLHLGPQGIHSLFVTDYTRSPGSSHTSKSWPSSLNDCVLQIEMWDDAARFAESFMKPGEYYSLKNVKMRIGQGGFMEAKMQQEKITQLEEGDSQKDIHFEALLRRKKEWESKETNQDLDAFRLIQDAQEGRFFHCVVELLNILVVPNRMPCFYVTDYTASTRLSVGVINQPWSNGLDGRIIQIMLSDEQSNIVQSAVTGTFWSVRNLRIKHNEVENCYCGILGGGEKLLVPLNINRTDNSRLNDLLTRKEAWARTVQPPQKPVVTLMTGLPQSLLGPEIQNKQKVFTRIRDMPLQSLDTTRLRLMAKVVDFYPLELKDAFYQSCSSCKKEIPSNRRACASCEDFEHEYIRYFYQMFILVEDSSGDQIRVSINDKCPLLAGLKRAHLAEDEQALKDFIGRVKPLVGSLILVHDDLKAGKVDHVEMPFLRFDLETWIIPEATRAFSLTTFEELDNV